MRTAHWCALVCLVLAGTVVKTAAAQDSQDSAVRGQSEFVQARFERSYAGLTLFRATFAADDAAQTALNSTATTPITTPASAPTPATTSSLSADDSGAWYTKWWVYALAGGVAVSAIALAGGDDDGGGGRVANDPLPGFPGTP